MVAMSWHCIPVRGQLLGGGCGQGSAELHKDIAAALTCHAGGGCCCKPGSILVRICSIGMSCHPSCRPAASSSELAKLGVRPG